MNNIGLRMCSLVAALVLGAGLVPGLDSGSASAATPLKAGEGQRRKDLDAMELKPFNKDLWSKLSDWKNGAALSDADTTGKVVLIAMWSDFHQPSKRALAMCRRLAERFGKEGLVIVAAHNARGWDTAEKPEAPEGAAFRLAVDAKGEFRTGLLASQDPNFYVLDRSGQMRYAAIRTESVEEAVEGLIGETAEQAAGVKDRIAAEKAAADAEARRSAAINRKVDLTVFPELPFKAPSEDEYRNAKWPKLARDATKRDEIAFYEAKQLTLSDQATDWLPKRPNSKGKITVIYFWHPLFGQSGFEMMREFDIAARQFARDVNFVGALIIPENVNGKPLLKEQKDPDKLRKQMTEIFEGRKLEHTLYLDGDQALWKQIVEDPEIPLPFTILVSSDGWARWWNTRADKDPMAVLRKMVEIDPGVRERRKVEAEWLKQQGK